MPSHVNRQPTVQTLHHKLPRSITTRHVAFPTTVKLRFLRASTLLWRISPELMASLSLTFAAVHAVVVR